MNNDLLAFAKNKLKEDGYFDEDCKEPTGEYVLELFETFLDQSHDAETFDTVPKLFFLLWTEMKNQTN